MSQQVNRTHARKEIRVRWVTNSIRKFRNKGGGNEIQITTELRNKAKLQIEWETSYNSEKSGREANFLQWSQTLLLRQNLMLNARESTSERHIRIDNHPDRFAGHLNRALSEMTRMTTACHSNPPSNHFAKHGLCSWLANSNCLRETGSRNSRKLMMSDAISATTITTMRCQPTTSQFSMMMCHVTLVREYNIHGAGLLLRLNGINA